MADGRSGWGMLYAHEFDAVCERCTSSEAVIYAALVTLRNHRTMTTPAIGISLIEDKAKMPRRTVFRCIANLTQAGLLTKERSGMRAVYGFPLVSGKVPPVALNDATSGTQHIQHRVGAGD